MSLKSVWKQRALVRLHRWAKARFDGYPLPLTVNIKQEDMPKMRAAIEKMLEDMKKSPARILIMPVTDVPAPKKKKIIYLNVSDVQIV